ncbi:SRPBCC domain-containing protein [Streptomyces cavernicola]|uniref:SRPBCC domain-containing protein n=1 Tax=Streptomyces cavernicola TaxID=3043613 RepID=A0ABT6SH86_9ACTN|nr:SRPBCC domain-containing protein [Streptomyces sp. B-S-A6]MDI3407566.1 SRPBCC domain-containing protein [Streptomyces sp. B-S-A6]
MSATIGQGTSRTSNGVQHLHFELHLPHPVEQVWLAVASARGLRQWLAAADVLEPRLGGAVVLRWLNQPGEVVVHVGRVSAWDVERVAEYTLDSLHGRMRFHLEPDGRSGTTLRFTNEFPGDDALRLDCLAGWHDHFEYLAEALSGHPVDWSTWTPARWHRFRDAYATRG